MAVYPPNERYKIVLPRRLRVRTMERQARLDELRRQVASSTYVIDFEGLARALQRAGVV